MAAIIVGCGFSTRNNFSIESYTPKKIMFLELKRGRQRGNICGKLIVFQYSPMLKGRVFSKITLIKRVFLTYFFRKPNYQQVTVSEEYHLYIASEARRSTYVFALIYFQRDYSPLFGEEMYNLNLQKQQMMCTVSNAKQFHFMHPY